MPRCFENNTADKLYLTGNEENCTNNIGDNQLDSSFIDDDDIEDARMRFERLRSSHVDDKQEICSSNAILSERRLFNLNDNEDKHSEHFKTSQ